MNYLLFFLCLLSGIVAGMGMGGGTFLIPILTIVFGFEQHTAQGINLLVFLPCAVVSLIVHFKNKLVSPRPAIFLIITGVLAAIPAAYLATVTNSGMLRKLFGGFLIIIGIFQLFSAIKNIRNNKKTPKVKHFKVAVFTTKMFK